MAGWYCNPSLPQHNVSHEAKDRYDGHHRDEEHHFRFVVAEKSASASWTLPLASPSPPR